MAQPLALERAAAARVSKEFARIKAAIEAVLARNQATTNAAQLLSELRQAASSAVDVAELRAWVLQHVDAIARFNAQQMTHSVGIKVSELLNAKTRAKLASISLQGVRGVPRETVNRIAPLVKRAIANGERGAAFEKEVAARLGLSAKKARRVAIGTVIRSNSALTEQRHRELGIVEYTWRASPDRLTRAWHRKLNGKRFRYDKPPKGGGGGPHDHGNPGSADTCRCQSIPVIPAKLKAQPVAPKVTKSAPVATEPARIIDQAGGVVSGAEYSREGMRDMTAVRAAFQGATAKQATAIATGKRDPMVAERGKRLPPIKLAIEIDKRGNKTIVLVDGRHRSKAAKEAGATRIQAEVRTYTQGKNGRWSKPKLEVTEVKL